MKEKVKLSFAFYDQYELPIYEDSSGKQWIDVDPRENMKPRIFEYEDGMPNDPFFEDKEIEFCPERKTVPTDAKLKMTWLVI